MEPFTVFSLGDVLLVAIQEEIDDAGITALLCRMADLVKERDARGAIIDLHMVEIVDSYLARHLEHLAVTLKLLRARVVVAGLSVPMVMTLLDFEIKLKGVEFALDVEQALLKLEQEDE